MQWFNVISHPPITIIQRGVTFESADCDIRCGPNAKLQFGLLSYHIHRRIGLWPSTMSWAPRIKDLGKLRLPIVITLWRNEPNVVIDVGIMFLKFSL